MRLSTTAGSLSFLGRSQYRPTTEKSAETGITSIYETVTKSVEIPTASSGFWTVTSRIQKKDLT